METVRLRRVCLVVICLVVGVMAVTASGSGVVLGQPADEGAASLFVQQDAADEIRISIELDEDGSAVWSIEFWRVLDDDESQAAFDSLRTDIETDPGNYTGEFAGRIETTVDAASNATGREMAASGFTVATERQSLAREYGVVRYTFEWDGFAGVDGEELRAGDAIEGMYLDDGTRLLMSWPSGYELQSVTPEPDDRRETAVLWQGTSTEFISGEPRIVAAPAGVGLGALAGGVGIVAVLTGLAGWLLRRRSDEESARPTDTPAADPAETPTEADDAPTDRTATEASATASADAADETAQPGRDSAEQSTGASADDSTSTTDSGTADDSEPVDDDSEPDQSLLSNEEQVMQLLEANGGRMKQQTVVKELGWTDAKTSKVVSGMREEGTIESFRIGRENVLTTPEDDPREPSP